MSQARALSRQGNSFLLIHFRTTSVNAERALRNEPFVAAGLTLRSRRLLASNSSNNTVNTAFVHPKPASFERSNLPGRKHQ